MSDPIKLEHRSTDDKLNAADASKVEGSPSVRSFLYGLDIPALAESDPYLLVGHPMGSKTADMPAEHGSKSIEPHWALVLECE